MLDHGMIEPSQSSWSSLCVLVSKPDYRKLNSIIKNDSHPIPRMDDYIDMIGKATYITKLDY